MSREPLSHHQPAGHGTWMVAVSCYILALLGAASLVGLVLCLGTDWHACWPMVRLPQPWLVNLTWLLVFGLQHSGMAREDFKSWWTRRVPAHLERSLYAGLSGVLLLGLSLTWQPLLGDAFWRGPVVLLAIPLSACLGMARINARFDHSGLMGLRQVREKGHRPAAEQLLILGPYRYLRHPLMACLLVFLWVQPTMTPTLAMLSGGMTLYIGLGIVLEERDLIRRFGTAYQDYRRRVPALIPWCWPASPAVYPLDGDALSP